MPYFRYQAAATADGASHYDTVELDAATPGSYDLGLDGARPEMLSRTRANSDASRTSSRSAASSTSSTKSATVFQRLLRTGSLKYRHSGPRHAF